MKSSSIFDFSAPRTSPTFWDDMTDNGQNRWKHRHREIAPASDRFQTAAQTTRSPDHASSQSDIDITNRTTPDHLTPIQQNQPINTTPLPQTPTPGPSHETPTQPTLLLTELPRIHAHVTSHPQRFPDPAAQPSPTPCLPPIGCGFEPHQAEAEETTVPATLPAEAQPSSQVKLLISK